MRNAYEENVYKEAFGSVVEEMERANTGVEQIAEISTNMADITERLLDIVGE